MKKILFWAAVTILAVASCNKIEEGAPVGESNVPAFEASVEGADTKTVIDGFKSYWDGTEGIRVLDGKLTNGKVYTTNNVEKAETATFVEKDGSVALSGDDYLAVYPEGPAGSVTWDGNVANAAKKFWLPGEDQKPILNSYDPSTHIAVAYTEAGNKNLEFKNVTSLVKFTLKSDNVTEVCFYGNSNEVITGNFDVTFNEGTPTYTTKGTGYKNNTFAKVKAASGKTLDKGTYYISVLPCMFSKGFAAETVAYGAKGTKKNSKEYTLERSQILDLGDLSWTPDKDATFDFELDTDNSKQWFNPGHLYVWTDGADKKEPLGGWPGTKMTKSGNTYSVNIPKEYIGKKLNYIVNNGGDWKSYEGQSMNPVKATQTIKGSSVGIN